jgi:hypothetical protein
MTMYRQCRLTKKVAGSTLEQTCWIPSQFAREGKVLRLRGDDGAWDNGWVVVSVGPFEQSEEEALRGARDWTRNRQATDV